MASNCAKDHESRGVCLRDVRSLVTAHAKRKRVILLNYLLKRRKKTYVFAVTFEIETALTNEVPDVASETVASDAFGRVFSTLVH